MVQISQNRSLGDCLHDRQEQDPNSSIPQLHLSPGHFPHLSVFVLMWQIHFPKPSSTYLQTYLCPICQMVPLRLSIINYAWNDF